MENSESKLAELQKKLRQVEEENKRLKIRICELEPHKQKNLRLPS